MTASQRIDYSRIIAMRKLQAMGVTTFGQATFLLALNYQPGIGTTELSKILGIKRVATSQLAKRLKDKGLVTWEGGEKMRRKYHLTQKGKQAIQSAREV